MTGMFGNYAHCEGLFWASAAETSVEAAKLGCALTKEVLSCGAECSLTVLIGADHQEIFVNAYRRFVEMRVKQTAKAIAGRAARKVIRRYGVVTNVYDAYKIIECSWRCVEA